MRDDEARVTGVDDLKYDDRGLIPAIVQEESTGRVLMLAYMNRESLSRTLDTGRTWFYSRSRQELWPKGETSGNVQRVARVMYDCDADTLLVQVEQVGVACHTGEKSCFYRELRPGEDRKRA
jgi:phosphoribosyl-AMP cyclohydrolase